MLGGKRGEGRSCGAVGAVGRTQAFTLRGMGATAEY